MAPSFLLQSLALGQRGHASALDKTGGLRAVSPNSNNPVLVSRIDDHSPRRKKKLPVQSAVLLSSAPRRLTGQNVGGISLGYEGVHVYRGWGYHGAHAGLLRHSPQRAPSL